MVFTGESIRPIRNLALRAEVREVLPDLSDEDCLTVAEVLSGILKTDLKTSERIEFEIRLDMVQRESARRATSEF